MTLATSPSGGPTTTLVGDPSPETQGTTKIEAGTVVAGVVSGVGLLTALAAILLWRHRQRSNIKRTKSNRVFEPYLRELFFFAVGPEFAFDYVHTAYQTSDGTTAAREANLFSERPESTSSEVARQRARTVNPTILRENTTERRISDLIMPQVVIDRVEPPRQSVCSLFEGESFRYDQLEDLPPPYEP